MIVTDEKYAMEKRLVEKLDLMAERCSGKMKLDNLIIIDGDEGYGKTNMAKGVAYYLAHKLNRPFSLKNMFFNIDEMLDFAKTTKEQIIVWDEAALQGMAIDWRNKAQQNLWKMLMVARKKRHVWIFNIPKYFKLSEYIIMDRAIALIHVYARKQTQIGRFVYYRKGALQAMYMEYRRKRIRNYKKYKTLSGTFPNLTDKIYSEKDYDMKKDEAIMSIGGKEVLSKDKLNLHLLKYKIASDTNLTDKERGEMLGNNRKTFLAWRNLPKKYPEMKEILEK